MTPSGIVVCVCVGNLQKNIGRSSTSIGYYYKIRQISHTQCCTYTHTQHNEKCIICMYIHTCMYICVCVCVWLLSRITRHVILGGGEPWYCDQVDGERVR